MEHRASALILIAGLLLVSCSGLGGTPTPTGNTPPIITDSFGVLAEGALVPAQFADLSFRAGGQVAEVLVAEGDNVEAGQTLARLGNAEQYQSAVAGARLELLSAQQAVSALYDSAALAAAQTTMDVAQAGQRLEDVQEKLDYALNPVGKPATEAVSDAQLARDTAQANLDLTKAGPLAQAVNSAQDAANQTFSLYQDAQRRYDECTGCNQQERDALLTAYNNALDQLSVARLSLETALAQQTDALTKAADRLQTAKNNLAALEAGPDESKVSLARAEVALAEATLTDAQSRAEKLKDGPDPDALALAQARVDNATAAVAAAEAALSNLELKAPFAGTVAKLSLKVGEQVSPGLPVVVLADFSAWVVETDNLTEIEAPKVSVGQSVELAFDALPGLTLPGEVTFISPLFETRQGDVTYTVKIAVRETDPRLQWGMTTVATFGE